MIHGKLFALTFVSALGAGLVAGPLFAFSRFVMTALARIPPAQGVLAMRSSNIAVMTPAFLLVFVGTALASIVVAIAALFSWEKPAAPYLLLGSALYLWTRYVSGWTSWNHVRTAAAIGSTAALILALCA